MRLQREVEGRADLLLQLAIEVDQHVAAGDEVGARKRRVLEQTVPGEQHDVAQLARDAVVIAFAAEEATEAIVRHVGFDGERIAALAADRQRGLVEIGGEHLDLASYVVAGRFLQKRIAIE